MNDLVKCLYEFMITKRLGSVWDDLEYTEMVRTVEMQMKRVEQTLTKDQQQEVQTLLEEISAQNSIESEHRFQASLGLARELSALVRAGRGV